MHEPGYYRKFIAPALQERVQDISVAYEPGSVELQMSPHYMQFVYPRYVCRVVLDDSSEGVGIGVIGFQIDPVVAQSTAVENAVDDAMVWSELLRAARERATNGT